MSSLLSNFYLKFPTHYGKVYVLPSFPKSRISSKAEFRLQEHSYRTLLIEKVELIKGLTSAFRQADGIKQPIIYALLVENIQKQIDELVERGGGGYCGSLVASVNHNKYVHKN